MGPALNTPRWFAPALLLGWALFSAWLVSGFAPPVDLPAHAAQLETLANLVRGDLEIARVYEIRFPQGYGLDYWLLLPLALLTNGAVAARVDLWAVLQLYVLGQWALLGAFRRSALGLLWGLPLAFNISYWYGLVPGLLAQALGFLALACFVRAVETAKVRWLVWLNVAAAATLLSHLLAFVALGVMLGAYALTRSARPDALRRLAIGLAAPVALSVPKVWAMATRAVTAGPWPATEYAALSHLNWFFRNYGPEGKLAAAGPLLVAAVLVAAWWKVRRREDIGPPAMVAAMVVLYLVTPKTLSGIFLISVRLPVLAGVLALTVVDAGVLPRWARGALTLVCLISLVETAVFHARFKAEVAGLEEMMGDARPPPHGYIPLGGRELLGSRNVYAEHLGQWLTATRGGLGHNFFADAEHHPVRFKPGVDLPASLEGATQAQSGWVQEVLTFGAGALPPSLADDFHLVQTAGHWRRWMRL